MQPTPPEMSLEPERLLTRTEYDQLVDLGCFEDERVELLYGRMVHMSPASDPHAWAVEQLNEMLMPQLVGRARVRIQSPLAVSDLSEPEPDVVVSPRQHRPGAHPEQALLVVEVADSSLRRDRGVKARLYAEADVPEYWVVNLQERCVEVFRAPEEGHYAELRTVSPGEALQLLSFPDVAIDVTALFSD